MKDVGRKVWWGLRTAGLIAVVALLSLDWFVTARSFDSALASVYGIYDNAIPSVAHLTAVSRELHDMCREARRVRDAPGIWRDAPARKGLRGELRALHHSLDENVVAYERFPAWPGEPPLQERLNVEVAALGSAVEVLEGAPDETAALAAIRGDFYPKADAVRIVVHDLLALNSEQAAALGRQTVIAHETSKHRTLLLTLAAALTIVIVWGVASRELVNAEGERERRLAELDAFAGRIAHDLKGPLSVVTLGSSLLRKTEAGNERVVAMTGRFEAATVRMMALIDGLLGFARAGAEPDPSATAALDEAVESIRMTIAPLLEAERAELVRGLASGLRVRTSVGALASIVQNLVRNAVLYLGESERRTVAIRAREEGAFVVIEVEDTGPGIPGDVARRIFRPFERGSTHVPGHGLGLATVKRLAESHGGRVGFRTVLGSGTTFWVRLPRA